MVIFIIHPYFPGQFKHLAPYLASNKENQVYFLANYNEADTKLENVKLVLYNSYSDKQKQWIDSTNILVNAAEATLYGQATIKAMIYLRDKKRFSERYQIFKKSISAQFYKKRHDNIVSFFLILLLVLQLLFLCNIHI